MSNLDNSVRKFGYENYEHYLKSDHWANFKVQYKNSDRPQHCIKCNDSCYQLHHLTYDRICKEKLADVIPLCFKCHKEEHAKNTKDRIQIAKPKKVFRGKKTYRKSNPLCECYEITKLFAKCKKQKSKILQDITDFRCMHCRKTNKPGLSHLIIPNKP